MLIKLKNDLQKKNFEIRFDLFPNLNTYVEYIHTGIVMSNYLTVDIKFEM